MVLTIMKQNKFIAALLRTDIVSRNVAAVVVSGDIALEFTKNYYYLYFRNTSVLFYGASKDTLKLFGITNITTILPA
jgi:hypothetical protein